jgi:hypothetical protein
MREVGYSMILNNDQLLEGLLLQDGLSIVRNQYLPWANGILLGAAAVAAVGRTVMPGMNGALKGLGMANQGHETEPTSAWPRAQVLSKGLQHHPKHG